MIRTFTFIILFTIAGSLTAQNTIDNSIFCEDKVHAILEESFNISINLMMVLPVRQFKQQKLT